MFKITNYSMYDNYTVTSNTENVSNIIDKLIRITAKITECFASDIYYDIDGLYHHIKEHESYDRVLFFRESGVWTVSYEDLESYVDNNCGDYIQTWRLTYDPETTETVLIRVNVRKENR